LHRNKGRVGAVVAALPVVPLEPLVKIQLAALAAAVQRPARMVGVFIACDLVESFPRASSGSVRDVPKEALDRRAHLDQPRFFRHGIVSDRG
jgi:hypothetical protein